MGRNTLTAFSFAACLAIVPAPSAHAQVSGLLKKKIKESVKTPDKQEEKAGQAAAADHGPQFNERVVELTKPVVEGLLKGLKTEIAQLEEFKRLLMTYKTADEYDGCQRTIAMSPEGQQIMMQFAKLPTNATSEQVQGATEKMNTAVNGLVAKQCGASITADWAPGTRQAKIDEIHRNAAAVAGLLLRGSSEHQPGEASEGDPPGGSFAEASPSSGPFGPGFARTSGLWSAYDEPTAADPAVRVDAPSGATAPYDTGIERFVMLCAYKKARPQMFKDLADHNLSIDAGFFDPALKGRFMVFYTAAEVQALGPLCDVKLDLSVGPIEFLTEEIRMAPIKITGRRKK